MSSIQTQKYNTLAIVGAGPVGMISALMLKEHFQHVLIFERMNRSSFLGKNGYTFPIVFSPQSIKVLEKVGVWHDLKTEMSEYFGVKIHKRIMGKVYEFSAGQDDVYSHWRSHLISKLYEALLASGIDVHFEARLESIDFEKNRCVESSKGHISFDLLLGADGMNSITRQLLSENHPNHAHDEFRLQMLHHWHAYKMPSTGTLREKFGGCEDGRASNIYLDNLTEYPSEMFRVITTSMQKPQEEISVLLRYARGQRSSSQTAQ